MTERICGKDITVIVQGHVRGKTGDPEVDRWTERSLKSLRRFLPDAHLILSTFNGCDVRGLTYDELVLSADPGYLDLGERNRLVGNTNRQIVSTQAALDRADRKYVLKMRYDLVLSGSDFLAFFGRFNERAPSWRILRQRIVSCTSVSLNPHKAAKTPYAPSDWFHFGLREDVAELWDVPLIPEVRAVGASHDPRQAAVRYAREHNYSAEQYLWVSFLRKHGDVHLDHVNDLSGSAVELTDLTLVNNLVLLEPDQIPVLCLKYSDPNMLTYSKQLNYTHAEWLQLYEQHCLRSYAPNGVRLRPVPPESSTGTDGFTSRRLLEVAIQMPTLAAEMDFGGLRRRLDKDAASEVDAFPGSNCRLLAALVKIADPAVTIEFGTGSGLNALCMHSQMRTGSCLATITCDGWGWKGPAGALLERSGGGGDSLIMLDLDTSLPENLDGIMTQLARADVLVLNLDDGRQLEALLKKLERERRPQDMLLAVAGIHRWSMAAAWNALPVSKLDLSSFGHPDGFGLAELKRSVQ